MDGRSIFEAKPLTSVQTRILDFINKFISENMYPPTVREICDGTGVTSTSTVHANLKKMSEYGHIKYTPSTRRAIVVCSKPSEAAGEKVTPVPIVGDVAAGTPILAIDNIQDYYPLPSALLHGAADNEAFMLKVRGDSMIEIGMLDGDLIVVNSAVSVDNGEIAVVRVLGDTATVKRFYREKDKIRLQPENRTMEPIIAELDDVEIVGKVVGLVRNY